VTTPRRVQGYCLREGQVLAVAEFLDKSPSHYWGATRAAVIRTLHTRLRELCAKWDRGSIDVREAGVCIQSDGEINCDGFIHFDILIDPTLDGRKVWGVHRIVPKAPQTRALYTGAGATGPAGAVGPTGVALKWRPHLRLIRGGAKK
jgi:hypothetical protein